MKMLIFGGSGKMGRSIAWDLIKQSDVEVVGLVDRDAAGLRAAQTWLGSDKIHLHQHDVLDIPATKSLMEQYNVAVVSLPNRQTSYRIIQAGVEAGIHLVDILEEYHRRPDPYETEGLEVPPGMSPYDYGDWLHETAIQNDVTVLDGFGFAPGMSNITTGEGIRKLDQAHTAVARVGGIPSKAASKRHPLSYMITWAFDHVLREYMVDLNVIKDGKIVEVPAMSDYERFRFTEFGLDEELECAVTPGMPSFLFTRSGLQAFAEKTVRWPGHFQGIETLKSVGMLDLESIEVGGQSLVPREVLLAAITPRLKPLEEDTDVCTMWNTVEGIKDGKDARVDYYLWDEMDVENGISSMGRVTGYSAAIGAVYVGRGEIATRGIVPPEDAIPSDLYTAYVQDLAKRGIDVLEKVSWG